MNKTNLSYSRVQTYNKCPRQYELNYITKGDKDIDTDTDRLDIGSLVHKGIEQALLATSNPVDVAVKAVKQAYEDGFGDYAPSVLAKAIDMLETYIPLLGLGTSLKPLRIKGKPAVEYWFNIPLTVNGVKHVFRGLIDAILINERGEVLLVDWKTRGRNVDDDSVILDAQLYIYAYVAVNHLGVNLSRAVQVQMLTDTPAVVTLTKKGLPSKVMRKTTKELFDSSMTMLGLDPNAFYDDFADKIVPRSEFVDIVRIDTSEAMLNAMWDRFMDSVIALDNDSVMRPVHSAYTCAFCDYKTSCFQTIDTETNTW